MFCLLGMSLINTLRYLFIIIYFFAGVNHFIKPSLYWPLIPSYLSDYKEILNILAGIAEVIVALLMCFTKTIKLSAWLTIAMLIAFIPSHVYFIQQGNLQIGSITITPIIAWLRLLIIHPLLIFWPWWLQKN